MPFDTNSVKHLSGTIVSTLLEGAMLQVMTKCPLTRQCNNPPLVQCTTGLMDATPSVPRRMQCETSFTVGAESQEAAQQKTLRRVSFQRPTCCRMLTAAQCFMLKSTRNSSEPEVKISSGPEVGTCHRPNRAFVTTCSLSTSPIELQGAESTREMHSKLTGREWALCSPSIQQP